MQRVEAADYYDIAKVSDPRLSPAGDAVVFVRSVPIDDDSYEATIYRVPIGGDEPERFTVGEGEDAEPRFSSGDRLAFVSTRGADDDRAQLWVMPTDGGEARQVTTVPGGVSDVAWSPDGSRIVFTQRTTAEERAEGIDVDLANAASDDPQDDGSEYEREPPDPRVIDRLVYRSREDRWFDGTRRHVYLAHLGDDDRVERLTEDEFDHAAPEWGDETTLYYAVKRVGDPDDNLVYDVDALDTDAGDVEQVLRTTGYPGRLAATDDGRIAFPYLPEDRATLQQGEVRVYDHGADETHEATATIDRTAGAFQWGPKDETIYVATPDEGAVALRRVPWEGGEADVILRDGHLDGFDVGEDAVAFVRSEWDHPGDVFAATKGGGEEARLTRINASYLDDRAVREPEEIRFDADGEEIQGWVLTPPDYDPDETYPLAVEIHGGPHVMWSTSGTMWHEFQTLAARGYVVFWCNPRGSAGYGEAFMAANERDWGDVTMGDVMAGVDRVVERDYVDGDELFLTGGSFGGYMTGWIVGHTDRFDAAVAQRGVYDLAGFYGTTDGAFKLVEGDWGTTPWEEPAFLREHSPAAFAHEVETPTLVVHAEEDYRVPIDGAETFYRLLRKNGVESRFVRYADEGHDLSRGGQPAHVVDRIERIARWFDGYSAHHDVPPAIDRGDEGLSTVVESAGSGEEP